MQLYLNAGDAKLGAVRTKYESAKLMRVSTLAPPETYPFGDEDLAPPSQ